MKASSVVSNLLMRCSAHRVPLLRTSSRPGDCYQEGTFLKCFHVVSDSRFQAHQFAAAEIDSLVRKLKTNFALDGLNRDPRVRVMLLHFRARLHQDEHDSKIWVLRKRFGATSATAGP